MWWFCCCLVSSSIKCWLKWLLFCPVRWFGWNAEWINDLVYVYFFIWRRWIEVLHLARRLWPIVRTPWKYRPTDRARLFRRHPFRSMSMVLLSFSRKYRTFWKKERKKEDKAPMSLKARRHQFQSSANYKALSLWIDCSWKTFININVWAYFICGFFIHLIFRWLFPKSHDFKWIIVEQTAQKWLVLSLAGDWAILRTLESLLRHKWPLLLAAKFGEISLRNWRKRNWRIIDAETDSSSTPESLFENVFIEARTNAGWTRFMIFFSLYFYKWIEIKIVFVPDCYLSRRFETKIFLSSICSNRKSMTVLFNLLFRCVSFTLLLMLLPRTSVEELLYR